MDLPSSEDACSGLFRMVRWRSGVYCPKCGSRRVKGHGNYGRGLKRCMCKDCSRTFNDKTGTIFHYSRLSLSWLIGRSYMPVFRALKRLMHKLRRVQPVRMSGTVECDEFYVTAGLKSRNNSHSIKKLGRRPRRRGLKRRGRGT